MIPRLRWGTDRPTVCHACDNHSCQRPKHLRLGTPTENRAEINRRVSEAVTAGRPLSLW
nr:HNH endonuclease [Streptomyces flavofungini]